MKHKPSVKNISICALCIALCYVLPVAFHALAVGKILSPMHIPVLLCGMLCGPVYGLVCGLLGPVLSSVLSGMPPVTGLITMVPELITYGVVTGVMIKLVRTRYSLADLYISLITAMVLGRIVGGTASALFFLSGAKVYSLSLWVSSYFIGTLPGILVQLLVLPAMVFALEKTRLISVRYPAY